MFAVPVCLLKEAVTEFASRASEKLRKQKSHTGQMLVFIQTSLFCQQDKQYSPSTVVPLRRPADDSRVISHAAHSWAVPTSTNWVTDMLRQG